MGPYSPANSDPLNDKKRGKYDESSFSFKIDIIVWTKVYF